MERLDQLTEGQGESSEDAMPQNAGEWQEFEAGFKDTVIVKPREQVRLLLRFEENTDPDNPYMYHCHILEHEDAGMMGQFVVTAN